jgi:hypothetical protein
MEPLVHDEMMKSMWGSQRSSDWNFSKKRLGEVEAFLRNANISYTKGKIARRGCVTSIDKGLTVDPSMIVTPPTMTRRSVPRTSDTCHRHKYRYLPRIDYIKLPDGHSDSDTEEMEEEPHIRTALDFNEPESIMTRLRSVGITFSNFLLIAYSVIVFDVMFLQ